MISTSVSIFFTDNCEAAACVAFDFLPTTVFLSSCFPPHFHLVHHRVQVKTALQQAKGRPQKRQHRNVSHPRPALLLRPACSVGETDSQGVLAVTAAAWSGVCYCSGLGDIY